MKKQGLMNGLIDWNNRNVCLSVFLQFHLAGWLAEVLRRRCFLCFILKATSSSSGVCTLYIFKSKLFTRVQSHPTYAQKDKSSAWRLSFLLPGYKSFLGKKNSKTESVVPFPGVQVTGKLSLLALSLFGLHGAADMLPASPLALNQEKSVFSQPRLLLLCTVFLRTIRVIHTFPLGICVSVYTYTHSGEE